MTVVLSGGGGGLTKPLGGVPRDERSLGSKKRIPVGQLKGGETRFWGLKVNAKRLCHDVEKRRFTGRSAQGRRPPGSWGGGPMENVLVGGKSQGDKPCSRPGQKETGPRLRKALGHWPVIGRKILKELQSNLAGRKSGQLWESSAEGANERQDTGGFGEERNGTP